MSNEYTFSCHNQRHNPSNTQKFVTLSSLYVEPRKNTDEQLLDHTYLIVFLSKGRRAIVHVKLAPFLQIEWDNVMVALFTVQSVLWGIVQNQVIRMDKYIEPISKRIITHPLYSFPQVSLYALLVFRWPFVTLQDELGWPVTWWLDPQFEVNRHGVFKIVVKKTVQGLFRRLLFRAVFTKLIRWFYIQIA